MADENIVEKDKIGRRTLLIIAAAALGAILLITGLQVSHNYLSCQTRID